jgi:4-amino-4-deoxy-L-arabinose transferase-like glycosyltransferase
MEFDTSPAAERRLTRSDTFAVGLFTVLYILQVAHAAVTRSFWLDELFTFYIVTMPDWAGMMDLIQRGPDQNPPLFYALTRLVVSVLGESEGAFRLPAMVGYWVLCVTLHLWVRLLGGGQTAALVAMTTPVFTNVVYYASEARPYGLMLGCFGAALVSYTLGDIFAQQPDYSRRAWLGLGASLSLAMAFHYLALIPIGCLWLMEACRTWRTRQWRWAVWAALCVPLVVLAYNWPVFTEQSKLPYWKTELHWFELPDFYRWMLGNWACLAFLVMVGMVVLREWRQRRTAHEPASPGNRRNAPEWLVLGLVLTFGLPVGWMVLMQATGKTMFTPRYLLPAVAGLAILLTFGVRHLATFPARILTAGIWVLLTVSTLWVSLQPWQLVRPSIEEIAGLPNSSLPVVLNVIHFLQVKHYYRDQLPQVVYVSGNMVYPQPKDPGRGLQALLRNPRTPRFEDFDIFLETHSRFYICCHKVDNKEMVQKLKDRQMPVIRETDEYIVYEFFKPNISTRPSLPHRIQPSQ